MKMYHKTIFSQSPNATPGIIEPIKFLLIAIVLTVIIMVGICITQNSSYISVNSNSANSNSVAQVSNVLPLQEPGAISTQTHLPGHDFGAINGSTDPGLSQRTDPPAFVYWVNGQMVVRRSEFGPLTDPVENSIPAISAHEPGRDFGAIFGAIDPGAILSVDPVEVSVPTNAPGHDFGAIYGAVDPGKNLCVDPPPFTYTFNGITIVRRSELGPFTETVDNCLQASVP
jgi:hypothetical protein